MCTSVCEGYTLFFSPCALSQSICLPSGQMTAPGVVSLQVFSCRWQQHHRAYCMFLCMVSAPQDCRWLQCCATNIHHLISNLSVQCVSAKYQQGTDMDRCSFVPFFNFSCLFSFIFICLNLADSTLCCVYQIFTNGNLKKKSWNSDSFVSRNCPFLST